MDHHELPIEVFAAKEEDGAVKAVFVSVPRRCGLKHAVALHLEGSRLIALGHTSALPIQFPELDEHTQTILRSIAAKIDHVAIAEFSPVGLFDAYMLRLEVSA